MLRKLRLWGSQGFTSALQVLNLHLPGIAKVRDTSCPILLLALLLPLLPQRATTPLVPNTVEHPRSRDATPDTLSHLQPLPHEGPKTSFTVYSFLARVLVALPTTKEVHFGSGKADLPGRHVALYTDLALPVCERQAGGGDLRRLVGPDGSRLGPVPHRRGVAAPFQTRGAAAPRALYA